jgi:hypothetical protein
MKAHLCSTLASLAALFVQMAAAQQQAPCDPGLSPFSKSPFAYRQREDRCEGLYIAQVAGTPLAIVSLTTGFEDYDPEKDKLLRFEWTAQASQGLHIRVRGIQPDLYYGMDVRRPGTTKTYEWPTAILAPLNILQPDIGVLGWTARKVSGVWRNVYVPLRVSKSKQPAPVSGYSLVLYPGTNLREVYLTLGPADADGQPLPNRLIKDREPQKLGYYPAEGPIRIDLPQLDPPGLYYLEVSATLPKGNPVNIDPLLIDTGP